MNIEWAKDGQSGELFLVQARPETVRTQRVVAEMAVNGLVQGERGRDIYVMCEIPSNVTLAKEFAEIFDGCLAR